jgi:hypothetical protein
VVFSQVAFKRHSQNYLPHPKLDSSLTIGDLVVVTGYGNGKDIGRVVSISLWDSALQEDEKLLLDPRKILRLATRNEMHARDVNSSDETKIKEVVYSVFFALIEIL